MNDKYKITDIANPYLPFLHRIKALRQIGEDVKAGSLGGYVESEDNLSYADGDDAWIYDCAIACNEACVTEGAQLRDFSVACDSAYVSHFAVLREQARAEDSSLIRYSTMGGNARISGNAIVRESECGAPLLDGDCAVYGTVSGNIHITGNTVVASGETIEHRHPDQLQIRDGVRSIERDDSRDVLQPIRTRKARDQER